MKKLLFLSSVLFLMVACGEETASSEKSLQTVKTDSRIQSIIRNPVSMDQPTDTVNVAKMDFEELEWDFGTIKQGEKVKEVS